MLFNAGVSNKQNKQNHLFPVYQKSKLKSLYSIPVFEPNLLVVGNYLQVNRLNAELRELEEQVELQEHEQEASISLRLQEVEMYFNQNFRIVTIVLAFLEISLISLQATELNEARLLEVEQLKAKV